MVVWAVGALSLGAPGWGWVELWDVGEESRSTRARGGERRSRPSSSSSFSSTTTTHPHPTATLPYVQSSHFCLFSCSIDPA